MISVKNKNLIKCINHNLRNRKVWIHRISEQHVQKVFGVTLILIRLNCWEPFRGSKRNCGKCWELSDKLNRCGLPISLSLEIIVSIEKRG